MEQKGNQHGRENPAPLAGNLAAALWRAEGSSSVDFSGGDHHHGQEHPGHPGHHQHLDITVADTTVGGIMVENFLGGGHGGGHGGWVVELPGTALREMVGAGRWESRTYGGAEPRARSRWGVVRCSMAVDTVREGLH